MENIQDIVTQIKQSTDYQVNKKILKEKILIDLHITYNNGLFKLSPEIFAFVSTWPDDQLFLEDVYENPILIDKENFLSLAKQHYHSIMNEWYQQHEQLKKIRKI